MNPEPRLSLLWPQLFAGLMSMLLVVVLVWAVTVANDTATHSDDAAKAAQRLAALGAQTHMAMCSYKEAQEQAVADDEAFLKLTLPERIAKYGSVGDVPNKIIKSTLTRQEAMVASLVALRCPLGGAHG